MSELNSAIVYGIKISSGFGELEFHINDEIEEIAEKYSLFTTYCGRDGEPPSSVVIGIQLGSYDENDNIVNLKELIEKEEKAKENFPAQQILEDIENNLEEDIKDLDISDTNTFVVQADE